MNEQIKQKLVHHLIDTGHTYSTEDGSPIRLRPTEAYVLLNEIVDYLEGEGYEVKQKANS